jgi:peptidoglycan/LPS O-acetylase OafA/YrhL
MSLTAQGVQSSPIRTVFDWLAARLSRVTSSREFIPEVDGLRFVALLPALMLHSTTHFLIERGRTDFGPNWTLGQGHLIRLLGQGRFGVELFFIISGFVVALPFARHELQGAPAPSLRKYFLRRVTRIEPPYILALVAMWLMSGAPKALMPDLAAGLFYLHRFVFGARNPIDIVTWSLEVEVFFYVLAPWLTRIYRIRDRLVRYVLQVALIIFYNYAANAWLAHIGPPRLQETILQYLAYFMVGILLADLYVSGLMERSRRVVWDVVILAGAVVLEGASGLLSGLYFLVPIILLLMFLGVMRGRFANAILRARPITIIGGMCYSAYLWHTSILILLRRPLASVIPHTISDGPAALLFCLLAVPMIIVVTAPIFFFIEKPFMNGPGSEFLTKVLIRIGGIFKKGPPINEERAVP